MINRDSEAYKEARWRVKIGHAFLEKGYDIKGVVHIGANDGYEVQYYLELGIEHVLAIEPYPLATKLFKEKYGNTAGVTLIECGIGQESKEMPLRIGPDTGQGSTFLRVKEDFSNNSPFKDTEQDLGEVNVNVRTWKDATNDIDLGKYDCLVVDVQGMELEVLKSIGDELSYFNYLNIECSEEAVFEGEAAAQEVIDYLDSMGYAQDSPIERHNDIFFIRKSVLK